MQISVTFCITLWILFLWVHSMIPSICLHHHTTVMKSNYIVTKDIVQKRSRKQTNSKKVADVSIMTPAHLSYCISVCQVHAVLSSQESSCFAANSLNHHSHHRPKGHKNTWRTIREPLSREAVQSVVNRSTAWSTDVNTSLSVCSSLYCWSTNSNFLIGMHWWPPCLLWAILKKK